jgi:hypothetical protein
VLALAAARRRPTCSQPTFYQPCSRQGATAGQDGRALILIPTKELCEQVRANILSVQGATGTVCSSTAAIHRIPVFRRCSFSGKRSPAQLRTLQPARRDHSCAACSFSWAVLVTCCARCAPRCCAAPPGGYGCRCLRQRVNGFGEDRTAHRTSLKCGSCQRLQAGDCSTMVASRGSSPGGVHKP